MTEITGIAQKRAWDAHLLPPVEQVRPGLWSVPVPIPNNPLRYVLVYMLELDNGIAIVDAGWNTDDAWAALVEGLALAGGSVSDVQAVVVTHIHPDHYGLAGRVREASGAWVGLHPADAALLQRRYVDTDELIVSMTKLMRLSGVPDELLPGLSEASMQIRTLVTMALPDRLLEDDQALELKGWDFRTIWTPGHSPGHLCLWSERDRLLLSGDHVLPRITPNISFHSQQDANPLGDYLESLARLSYLDPEEVLPGHEYRFSNLGARLNEIQTHHTKRMEEIKVLLEAKPGATCWELTLSLTWSRSFATYAPFMQRAANGETLAHLVLMERRGRVRREIGEPATFFLAE
jgi:glyoxylase-like metal-dependent hydrolase (beta-lactamase superfamily II)